MVRVKPAHLALRLLAAPTAAPPAAFPAAPMHHGQVLGLQYRYRIPAAVLACGSGKNVPMAPSPHSRRLVLMHLVVVVVLMHVLLMHLVVVLLMHLLLMPSKPPPLVLMPVPPP